MSQYYRSNSPYSSAHNQDGVMNGAIIGGLAGAGAMGTTHAFGRNAMQSLAVSGANKQKSIKRKMREIEGTALSDKFTQKDRREQLMEQERRFNKADKFKERAINGRNNVNDFVNDKLGKGGNWKTRTASYGVSALAGMAIGAGADALID